MPTSFVTLVTSVVECISFQSSLSLWTLVQSLLYITSNLKSTRANNIFTIDLKMKSWMGCYIKYIQKLMLFLSREVKLYDTEFGFSIWKDIFETRWFKKDRLSLERTFEIKVQFSILFTQSFDTATKKSKNFTLLNFGMTYWCVFSTCSAYFEVPTEFQTCQNMRALGKMILL